MHKYGWLESTCIGSMITGHIGASTCIVVKTSRAGQWKQLWFLRCYVLARDTHRSQKRGGIKPLFVAPICTCPIPSWQVVTPHPSCRQLSPTPSLSYVRHIPRFAFIPSHLSSTHYTTYHFSLHLCHPHSFFLASVSPLPGYHTLTRISLHQSSHQTLIHVCYLAIPLGI